MTLLSVNVNKVAVLRNSRGGATPDVVHAATACLDAGAHGITVHPRPDARHIRADDVHALAACVDTARLARTVGLGVNAGHDLDQANLGAFARAVPGLLEVSIGHALVGEALHAGLDATVRAYLAILADAAR